MNAAPSPAVLPLRPLTELWAGAASAAIFYAEYLGLGSMLGDALLPSMPNGASLGTLLVMLPVVVCSLLAFASHGAALAGPRAASVTALTGLLALLIAAYPGAAGSKTLLLAVVTACAGLTLLAGRLAPVRQAMALAPTWLVQGFMYATALGIVAGSGSAGRLVSCLQIDSTATWLAYLPPVLLGIVWKPVMDRFIAHAKRSDWNALLLKILAWLPPLGLLAAAGLSWWIYQHTLLRLPNGGACGRFGDMHLDWSLLAERGAAVARQSGTLSVSAWAWAALAGVAVGLVLLLESLTAFAVNTTKPEYAAYVACQPRMLSATAAGNLLSATVGGAPASFSTSRTVVLRDLGGKGRLAVPVHGLVLVCLALFASPWIAQVPKLSAAVALTLVGVQMVGGDTERLWQRGYRPGAVVLRQGAVVLFWLVLLVSLLTNNTLIGFVALAAFAMLRGQHRNWRRRKTSRAVAVSS